MNAVVKSNATSQLMVVNPESQGRLRSKRGCLYASLFHPGNGQPFHLDKLLPGMHLPINARGKMNGTFNSIKASSHTCALLHHEKQDAL